MTDDNNDLDKYGWTSTILCQSRTLPILVDDTNVIELILTKLLYKRHTSVNLQNTLDMEQEALEFDCIPHRHGFPISHGR